MSLSSSLPRSVTAVLLACAALLWPLPPASAADAADIEVRKVEIGYGGAYKSGYFAPIWVTLRSPTAVTGDLEVLAPDGDGAPVAFPIHGASGPTTRLEPNVELTVYTLAKIGPERSTLSIRLREPDTKRVQWQARFPASTPRPLPSTREIVVSLGSSAAADAGKLVRRGEDRSIVSATIAEAARVPDVWWGWEGVETVVLSTSAGAPAEKLSPQQFAALRQWVEIGGGRLVICAGERGGDFLAAGQPLADLAPGKLVDVLLLRDLAKLEELTGEPLAVSSDSSRPKVAHLSEVRGQVELTVKGLAGDLPLLVRASHGMGEVAFLAVDPDGPALVQWPGRASLLFRALAGGGAAQAQENQRRSASRLGYEDLSGQLRAALDYFPQIRLVSITTVALLTLFYLALIGPAGFLAARQLKRPGFFTWFTFLLLVLVFCALGWYLGRAAHGTAIRANVCEVIDIDLERQLARGTTWVHLFDPETSSHDLALQVDPAPIGLTGPVKGWTAWQGLPGNGLGGLAANQLAAPMLTPYKTSIPGQELALSGVPIQTGGSKAMGARWWADCNLGQPPTLTLNQFKLLEGEIVNPLPVELHDSLLVYDEWMYRLRVISPQQRVQLTGVDPLNLEARLQQRTVANAKDVLSPWERDSTDVPRIVQMMMFHESARGTTYTSLTHHYQGFLDLTPRARNGRAILVGRISRPITELTLDAAPFPASSRNEEWTFVRILFPVTPRP